MQKEVKITLRSSVHQGKSRRQKLNILLWIIPRQSETLNLLVLLAAQPSQLVCNHTIKLCSSFDDLLPLYCGDIVSNLCTVRPKQLGQTDRHY
ncbi:uncharacterized protein J3R85_001413 [Psidium guajava]|nr:uncharacterized protein J3R85_001413 [Psidium guajava]